jgi:NAD(P)-dependent dehydrogenase (short-subunit alcohol dehydrogenase family)
MHVVITGASRGIGLEFVRRYLSRGDHVVAACRDPDRATELAALAAAAGPRARLLACDVASDASVAAFAAALGDAPVDLLVNNAGVAGGWESLDGVATDVALDTYNVNALGPVRVTRALLPHLARASAPRVAHISSGMGSIADNGSGGAYAYRMSKAALNMAARNLAVDLRPRGVVSVAINPGWVATDMGGANAPTAVGDSVAAMVARFDALTLADSGKFLDWTRAEGFPW